MIITVYQNQSIYDIATMYTGDSGNAIALLLANDKKDTTLKVGEQLLVPDSLVSKKTVKFYQSEDLVVGTVAVVAGVYLADNNGFFIVDNHGTFIEVN